MGWFSSSRSVQRLTAEQVRMIRQAFQAGHTQAQIAEMYGVPASTVCDIINRRTWRDL